MAHRRPGVRHGEQVRRSARALLLCAFCSAAWLLPPPMAAHAQPAASEPQLQARTAYSAGVAAFQRADYAQAREQFAAADQAFSSPNIRLMLGRALLHLGQLREAHAVLTSALEAARGAQRYEATARAARDELQELNKSLAIINLRVDDPTGAATLSVADQVIARDAWDEPIIIEPGAIRITLTGPDGQADVKELEMTGGSAATLAMVTPEAPVAPAPEPAALTPAATAAAVASNSMPERSSASSSSRPLQSISYVAAGVGVAGLVAFGVLGALSNHEYTDLDKKCPDRLPCDPKYKDNATRGRTYQTIANVSLGVGVGAIATGLVLWMIGLPQERGQAALTPSGARLIGSF
jgi:tetratricopeptide (TPR) repeat protein